MEALAAATAASGTGRIADFLHHYAHFITLSLALHQLYPFASIFFSLGRYDYLCILVEKITARAHADKCHALYEYIYVYIYVFRPLVRSFALRLVVQVYFVGSEKEDLRHYILDHTRR